MGEPLERAPQDDVADRHVPYFLALEAYGKGRHAYLWFHYHHAFCNLPVARHKGVLTALAVLVSGPVSRTNS